VSEGKGYDILRRRVGEWGEEWVGDSSHKKREGGCLGEAKEKKDVTNGRFT